MRDLPEPSDLPEDEDFPPLPPPDSPGQGPQDEGDPFGNGEEGELSRLAEVPAPKRKGVKRPQPKLDSQRLTSERGLPALRTLFDNVRFKGKGHEAEDLRLLMQKMENWAHRLYPKLQFEDFIDKVEKLGSKKEVQTCLKRIRLDMPLTHEDFTGEEAAPPELQAFDDPDPFSSLVHSTPAPVAPPPLSPPPPPSLTEEQRRRMELNRQRALERRLARNQQTDPSDSQTVESSESEATAAPTSDVEKREQEGTMEEEEEKKEQEKMEQEEEEQPQQPSPEDQKETELPD